MIEEIQINFSDDDIPDIVKLLNKLLEHISLVTLSREELSIIEGNNKVPELGNGQFSDVVETINRFGIRDDSGDFYALLNDMIDRIASCNPMLQI